MPSDYAKISAENTVRYGTEVSYYGSDFSDRYTERTHFIFELLQNAEDALRWREEAAPDRPFPHTVTFRLFPNHLEITHSGLLFTEEHVRAICSIKRGTKAKSLNDIGKFGIGFKSVYAYTKCPEVHSGDEHFVIEDYVHPRPVPARPTDEGQTLFYIPFDHDEIPVEQAYAEIAAKLAKLGHRTLLFLHQIESVDWTVSNGPSGTYGRQATRYNDHREVALSGRNESGKDLPKQRWLIFSRRVNFPKGDPAGQVEVAFRIIGEGSRRSVARAEDSTLAVFFPTEKETQCGFLMQGPYKTTSSRDNVPHDNQWNAHLVNETAKLLADTLHRMPDLKLASVGLLQAMPLLLPHEIPDDWMFRPVYDAIIETLKTSPLIPAANDRFVSAECARFARGKGLAELFPPQQLSLLLGAGEGVTFDWVTSEVSEARSETSDLFHFLRQILDVDQVEPEDLPNHLGADFFAAQRTSWMVKFYSFLLDQERLWRRDSSRANLLRVPFIRLQDNTHVLPFKPDGAPNVYLPADTETDFDTVHRLLAKPKKCVQFLRKLGLTEPDITSEVLQKVIPQYEPDETNIPERKHLANLRKIFRALSGASANRGILLQRLKGLSFLFCVQPGSKKRYRGTANTLYFRTRQLETFFENEKDVWFLDEPQALASQDKIKTLLRELGVEDKPRRLLVEPEDRREKQRKPREGYGHSWDAHYHDYDIQGLASFLKTLKKVDPAEATRRARLIWDFLTTHLENYAAGSEKGFFEGEYQWSYYSLHTKRFDALFLNRLRTKEWLPRPDGQLHKPSELLPQELPQGFTRNPALCEALQMKAEVLVNLAKEAGFKVEDLMLIRRHKDEFEKFKRMLKDKPVPNAKPIEPPPKVILPTEPPQRGTTPEPEAARPAAAEPQPAPAHAGAIPVSPNDVAQALANLLGPDAPPPTVPPADLLKPETPAGRDTTGTPPPWNNGGSQLTSLPPRTHTGRSQDGKYFTFVYVAPNGDGGPGDRTNGRGAAEIDRREKVGRGGVDAVLEFEKQAGRSPTEMDHFHEGYDVESRNPAGEIERFIEVKAISAAWGERGVTLSQPQFTSAQQSKDRYWLYVVENPGTPSQVIHRIQNPALQVKSFAYDHRWQALAEANVST
jgi:hypothetical protein